MRLAFKGLLLSLVRMKMLCATPVRPHDADQTGYHSYQHVLSQATEATREGASECCGRDVSKLMVGSLAGFSDLGGILDKGAR